MGVRVWLDAFRSVSLIFRSKSTTWVGLVQVRHRYVVGYKQSGQPDEQSLESAGADVSNSSLLAVSHTLAVLVELMVQLIRFHAVHQRLTTLCE